MSLSRRTLLMGAGALPLAAGNFGFTAFAQTAPGAPGVTEVPPMLFAHGNGEQAPLWMTTLWRMESNGVARERMFAINFTDPSSGADDTKPEPNKSSTQDQRRELGEAVKELKRRTGAPRVALVGNSRGGYSIRNYIKNGGGGDVSRRLIGNSGKAAKVTLLRIRPVRPQTGDVHGLRGFGLELKDDILCLFTGEKVSMFHRVTLNVFVKTLDYHNGVMRSELLCPKLLQIVAPGIVETREFSIIKSRLPRLPTEVAHRR